MEGSQAETYAVQVLRAEVREGFRGVHQRLDDVRDRLDQVNGKVGKAHDRAARLEEGQRGINSTVSYLRKRLFHLEAKPIDTPEERRSITRRDVAMFLAGGGAIVGAWKFAEWAIHTVTRLP